MPIWGIVNQKGGVGKTTTAVNLAAGLAMRGARTLLIDADPQGNATSGLGVPKDQVKGTLLDVLQDAADRAEGDTTSTGNTLEESIHQVEENLFVLPATLDLAGAEQALGSAIGKELLLRDALEDVRDSYDFILIDAPPSLGLLTINILAAADAALVPMQCEFYALEGLSHLMKTIQMVRKRINPNLEVKKVLLTMYDPRNNLTQQVEDEIKQFFDGRLSKVRIPRNVRLSEAPGFGEPAVSMYPGCKGSVAYMELVEEVLEECAVH